MSDHPEVLAWINQVREEHSIGAPLDAIPLGTRRSMAACPIANGLAYGAPTILAELTSGCAWIHDDEGVEVVDLLMPIDVRAFVRRFDRGDLPQYDEASH